VGELHLGVILPNYGSALAPEHLAAVAVAAEEAGFDSGWVSDHLMVAGLVISSVPAKGAPTDASDMALSRLEPHHLPHERAVVPCKNAANSTM
jgi:alkanesulfonate monooxygenase SsuD/methylene tetrahydromethanopterin reductase-like flavin-dependent oxidoreductase (luciferase family)